MAMGIEVIEATLHVGQDALAVAETGFDEATTIDGVALHRPCSPALRYRHLPVILGNLSARESVAVPCLDGIKCKGPGPVAPCTEYALHLPISVSYARRHACGKVASRSGIPARKMASLW